jgi:hypothetical protein
MEVKNDTTNATSGGTHMAVSMPAVGKYISIPPVKTWLYYHAK